MPAKQPPKKPAALERTEGVQAGGITISHPERLIYPEDAISKLEVARYYEQAGEAILPYLIDRPMAVVRAPDGIADGMFFQKSFKVHLPAHVKETTLDDGTDVFYVRSVEGIISLAQFGAIEFHPWGSRLPAVDKPDVLIWDLDHHVDVPWTEVLDAAFLLREFLAERDLDTVVKTSGGKGLHVILPLRRRHGWDVMKAFSRTVASAITETDPQRFTVVSSLEKRTGKIYIDWLRNGRGATCVAPWSLRARNGAPVSMPLDWDDLPKLPARGYSIMEPRPSARDWMAIKPQSIRKSLLGDLGL